MRHNLQEWVQQALTSCYQQGTLQSHVYPEFSIEIPAHSEHGDFATNVAMLLAKAEKRAPREIAEILVATLQEQPSAQLCRRIELAGPGFINFFLQPEAWGAVLHDINSQQAAFGCQNLGQGQRVQVEFVSANPTGPLHIGHGRGAALGDALARILAATGYQVQREYYINDAGTQMQTLGRSIAARYQQLYDATYPFPEEGYQGDYIRELACRAQRQWQDTLLHQPQEEVVAKLAAFGGQEILAGIEKDLADFGVSFDTWFSETWLHADNRVQQLMEQLQQQQLAYWHDGALWLRTSEQGDDKDRVLLRSNGETTYFAADIVYHQDKLKRGFARLIDIWGADHHGYVARMQAAMENLQAPAGTLQILLVQLVNLLRQGQPVAMSTRAGEFVTLRQVLDEVGKDACRFYFLMRRPDSKLDFDLDLAKAQSNDNPVYYVQYAHARICSVNETARQGGCGVPLAPADVDLSLLAAEREMELLRQLSRYPEVVAAAAQQCEPHRLTHYVQELAAILHSYYNQQKIVVPEDSAATQARLVLVNGVRVVLANALGLLGIEAPQAM